jgi:serine/threonine-protein kinase
VPGEADRERFLRETASLARIRPPAPPAGGPPLSDSSGRGRVTLSEQELERAQAALTQYVGPIARVLVRRAAANASSVEVLWQALSTHIESPAERAAFLKQRPS